jgi:putative oxidoreductase
MNRVSTVARYLLGLLFVVIGLNGFFHFLPLPPPTSSLAVEYFAAVMASHYIMPIFLLQLISGILLLVNRFVPFALVILAAILFNILLFHITMDPKGIGLGVFAAVLWVLVFAGYRSSFRPILSAKPATAAF